MDELDRFCRYELEIDYENIPGTTKIDKVHHLVDYFRRRNTIENLAEHAAEQRPNLEWHKKPLTHEDIDADAPSGFQDTSKQEKQFLKAQQELRSLRLLMLRADSDHANSDIVEKATALEIHVEKLRQRLSESL